MAKTGRGGRPSERELQVLGVLWERGASTARQVLQALPDGSRLAYTTVLTIMQGMERKGLLTRTSENVAHVWRPAVSRARVMGPLLRNLVRNAFGGRASLAMQHLLGDRAEIGRDERAAIRKLLAGHARRKL